MYIYILILITHIRGLITPLITTPEPPSRAQHPNLVESALMIPFRMPEDVKPELPDEIHCIRKNPNKLTRLVLARLVCKDTLGHLN